MSSFGQNIWKILAVSKVNSLSNDQLNGLTSSQLTNLINSPNYDSFSSTIRNYATSTLNPTKTVTNSNSQSQSMQVSYGSSSSNGNLIKFENVILVLSIALAQFLIRS